MVLAEKAVEAAAVEEDGQIATPFPRTLAEPGSTAVGREKVKIKVDKSSVPACDGTDPPFDVLPDSAVTSLARAGPAFIGTEFTGRSGRIPGRPGRKTIFLAGLMVNTQGGLVLGQGAEAGRTYAYGSCRWCCFADRTVRHVVLTPSENGLSHGAPEGQNVP